MTAHRASILAASATAALLLASPPAIAQVNGEIVLNIMRECAKIDDPTARLACYDNNIRSAGGTPRAPVSGQVQAPQGGTAPITSSAPSGFGAESVRTPRTAPSSAQTANQITSTVQAIREREPGIYAITLEDGAQWRFTNSVPRTYRVPRVGSTVEIERGALGSFLLRFDRQSAVGVVRDR